MQRITKTHIEEYLTLRKEVAEREAKMAELKERFTFVIKANGGSPVETPAGKVSIIERELKQLNKDLLMQALKTDNLDPYTTVKTSEAVMVTAA